MFQGDLQELAFEIYKGKKLTTLAKEYKCSYNTIYSAANIIYKTIDNCKEMNRIGFVCFINSFILSDRQRTEDYIKKVIAYHLA